MSIEAYPSYYCRIELSERLQNSQTYRTHRTYTYKRMHDGPHSENVCLRLGGFLTVAVCADQCSWAGML